MLNSKLVAVVVVASLVLLISRESPFLVVDAFTPVSDKNIVLKPCDIFLTGGPSLISKAIRIGSRKPGEATTKVSHAGIIVEEGSLYSAIAIEALAQRNKVVTRVLKAR